MISSLSLTRSGPSSGIERRCLLAHRRRSEIQLRLVRIVRSAPKLEVLRRALSSIGKRHDVMELEETTLAAPAVRPDECAASFVASPHLASDRPGLLLETGASSGANSGRIELTLTSACYLDSENPRSRDRVSAGAVDEKDWNLGRSRAMVKT
jgi:hypothetical protein